MPLLAIFLKMGETVGEIISFQKDDEMAFKISAIPQDKIMFAFVLLSVIGLFALVNFLFARQPKLDTQMVHMATLQGHGALTPLHYAMDRDPDLTKAVRALSDFRAADMFVNHKAMDEAVVNILFQWAGVVQVPDQSFGPYIDARVAAFLQVIGALPQTVAPGTEISLEDAGTLNQTWFRAYEHYRTRLLAQALGSQIFQGGIHYDLATDKLSVNDAILPVFVTQFESALQSSADSGEAMHSFLAFIDQVKGFNNLSSEEQDMIMSLDMKPQEPSPAAQDGSTGAPGAVPLPAPLGAELAPPAVGGATP